MSEHLEHNHRAGSSTLMTDLRDRKSTTAFLKSVVAQASFVAALMFYLGAMYTTSFYGYFNLTLNTLNLGFSGLVLQSLHLLRREVLVVAVIVLVAAGIPWPRSGARFAERGYGDGDGSSPLRTAAARLHLVVVGAGLVLLVISPAIAPYGWVAPLTVAAGLLLGQCRDTTSDRRAGLRHKALPFFAAAVFLFWALTQITWQLGERDAKERARDMTRWTGVLILSTHRLALPQDSLVTEDLGAPFHPRYRYTGLRLLLERDGRYYVVSRGWKPRRDPLYVIRESDDVWVALTSGTQPRGT
ncbi:hypothetical protein N4G69_15465 [Streptomyces mirabilis]|uniref:hypothetical protein n=1 Tax=Streptomyces mirabilis TaxID=68239 RepID=UPI0021BDF738|nr:hypothetical protein [Streptomyces mirabilis]MCT9107015.1 hypothetical protein [Streptomyces mirabilis]